MNRKLPLRQVEVNTGGLHSEKDSIEKSRRLKGRGLPEAVALKEARKDSQFSTLKQIEEVLDNLNSSTNDLTNKGSQYGSNVKETISRMKNFAKPSTQIDGLVDMITKVLEGLE